MWPISLLTCQGVAYKRPQRYERSRGGIGSTLHIFNHFLLLCAIRRRRGLEGFILPTKYVKTLNASKFHRKHAVKYFPSQRKADRWQKQRKNVVARRQVDHLPRRMKKGLEGSKRLRLPKALLLAMRQGTLQARKRGNYKDKSECLFILLHV